MNMNKCVLDIKEVSKGFPGVRALSNVSLTLREGTVHSVVGENGAGKSTLMKCIFGIYKMDNGEIFFDGKKLEVNSIRDARDVGISFIQQELDPVRELTVMENVFLGRELRSQCGLLDKKTMIQQTQAVIDRFGIGISPKQKMSTLSAANQQLVEIMTAVSLNARVIIMDEPTSALTVNEIDKLYEIIHEIKKDGTAILYISHRMNEIFDLSDECTVLRDGCLVAHHASMEGVTEDILVKEMVGRDMSEMYNLEKHVATNEEILRVEHVNIKNKLHDVGFTLKRGEILGLSGLMGAGRTETLEVLFGLRKAESGDVYLNGKLVNIKNPGDAIQKGFAMVTEERRYNGIFPQRNLYENIMLINFDSFVNKLRIIDKKASWQAAQISANNLKVNRTLDTKIRDLSGGNQQKVILARWLLVDSDIILLDEPTRGIDVGAKAEIYSIISNLASHGKSIIMVSSEMVELIRLCDRVVVMHEGRVTGELSKDALSEESIMKLAIS